MVRYVRGRLARGDSHVEEIPSRDKRRRGRAYAPLGARVDGGRWRQTTLVEIVVESDGFLTKTGR